MATVEITISSRAKGKCLVCEKFEISREQAQELMTKMEAMVADFPGHHPTTRTVRPNGITVVEIELNRDMSPKMVHPNFELLFRQRRN